MLAGASRGFCWKYSCRRREYWRLGLKVIQFQKVRIGSDVKSKQTNKRARPLAPTPPGV